MDKLILKYNVESIESKILTHSAFSQLLLAQAQKKLMEMQKRIDRKGGKNGL